MAPSELSAVPPPSRVPSWPQIVAFGLRTAELRSTYRVVLVNGTSLCCVVLLFCGCIPLEFCTCWFVVVVVVAAAAAAGRHLAHFSLSTKVYEEAGLHATESDPRFGSQDISNWKII